MKSNVQSLKTAVAILALSVASGALAQTANPLPETISEAARAAVAKNAADPQPPEEITARRAMLDKYQEDFGAKQRKRYAVDIKSSTIAGVPVRLISATGAPKTSRILINMHGGGFTGDSGSLTENIPIAALTKMPVVAVRYRLATEYLYPAAVEDGLAVYRELLKTHKASEIGIYGTSAGAVLGPQLIARIHKEGLPMPGAYGMFSGDADLTRRGDTIHLLGVDMLPHYRVYAGKTPVTDPLISATINPAAFFPPTLCMSSTRDFYLSGTVNFCRHLENEGVENKLVVFDGLPHAFWGYLETPESDEAFAIQARFFRDHLSGRKGR